jgi:5'-nucleotidase
MMALQGPAALARPKPESAQRLTILHTNDVHSHLEPMSGGEFAGFGGAPARAAFVNNWRRRDPNLLLLDAGDILQGTPYFNIFKGEPEIKAMDAMGFHASTIGNHEFDAGIDRLAELARLAKLPLLNCNYDFSDTPMAGLTQEYTVRDIGGLRVGIFGVGIRMEGLVQKDLYGATQYRDPIENARRVARHLREEERCDFIICLSHINLYSGKDPGDRDLIREIPEIGLVIGGHNHILLPVPEVTYRSGEGMGYVAQAGWAGTHMGVLQFDLYDRHRRELAAASADPLAAVAV